MTTTSQKNTLWLAIVEHKEISGDRLKLYFQPNEPGTKEVKESFANSNCLEATEKAEKVLRVVGVYNLSSELANPENRAVLEQALAVTAPLEWVPDPIDLKDWDQIEEGWYYQVIGETEVHLNPDVDLGYEVSVRRDGMVIKNPDYYPNIEIAYRAAEKEVRGLVAEQRPSRSRRTNHERNV